MCVKAFSSSVALEKVTEKFSSEANNFSSYFLGTEIKEAEQV